MSTPVPFTLSVPDSALADLRARLALTRFPDQVFEPWEMGSDLGFMQRLTAYWRDGFDWRAAEARLNALPQFRVRLDGFDQHFIRVEGQGPSPVPLLLVHGWPGSVLEFLDIIPRLTDPGRFGGDPADAVTVIAPSLPGYTLSFQPGQARFGVEEMAGTLARLMTEVLGYDRFAAQGGDWGSFVTSRIAYEHPDRMIGLHLNMVPIRRDPTLAETATAEERAYAEALTVFLKEETGYQWIQGTRPLTLAYGLTDSPAGLAAWIIEKFQRWADCGGDPLSVFSMDQLLANVSLYWFTGSIGSSFHPYHARMHRPWPIPDGGPITVPTGYAAFPTEIVRPPRSLAARTYRDIRRWTVMERGGHFAAMEQPEALAREILAFLRPLRA
ncbi:epoxide hydrolase family protein [Prosthecomicrobium sp. N25]|uniref:epoxide hydrolase family protein n=1 Tax=Prosthecomicrobium sp. N25 TaxID=3129254 RepID=UPI003077FA45